MNLYRPSVTQEDDDAFEESVLDTDVRLRGSMFAERFF